jgi:NitT/TauT family transport system ATP-binding protein
MRVRCQDVSKTFATRSGPVVALNGVSFAVEEQQFVSIVGPSGCGKTTLLRLIAGLVAPTSGSITFRDEPKHRGPRAALVFQQHGLFPWMSVLDNVAFGLQMSAVPRQERRELAMQLISRFGLQAFAQHYPHELSLGMSQRVAIARAFVTDPPVLLMDEPFGSVDVQTKLVLQEELLRVWRQDRKLVIYVTHDIEEAVRLGDRVLVMTGRPGRIQADIPVPLLRPRNASDHTRSEVVQLTWQIWKMLEEQVRASLGVPDAL